VNEPTQPQGHPDDETLAAFLDDRLGSAERARVTEHLSRCEACHELFAETVRFQAAQAPSRTEPKRFPRSPIPWAIGAAAAALVAGVALVRGGGGFRQARPGPMAELVTALEGERPIEPRLAGGFRYAPPRDVTRGAAPGPTPSWKVLAAAAKVKEEAERSATPDALSALGVAHLVLGEEDAAVASLEKALKSKPNDAALLTDLSAAYLTRAKRKDEPEDIVRGLDTADRAIEADPKIAEPHFNRALALEALGRGEMAKKAWGDYLERDPSSEWAREARRRLEAIKPARSWKLTPEEKRKLEGGHLADAMLRAVSERSAAGTREHIERDLVLRWASAELRGDIEDAEGRLVTLRRVIPLYSRASGDALLRDSLAAIEAAHGTERHGLALGHMHFDEGWRLYSSNEIARATERFRLAATLLRHGNSPYAAWPDLYEAIGAYYSGDLEAGWSSLIEMEAGFATRSYPVLAGRVLWMKGLVSAQRGQLADAVEHYGRALSSLEAAHENGGRAAVHALLAEAYLFLGERKGSWRHRVAALALLDATDPTKYESVLMEAAVAAREEGYARAALELHDAAGVRLAAASPKARAEALVFRAMTEHDLGQNASAKSDLADAARAAAEIRDPALSARTRMHLAAFEGELIALERPRDAEQLLSSALGLYESFGGDTLAAELLVARGRTRLACGRPSDGKADFESAIRLLEKGRERQRAFSVSYFARALGAYDEMTRLEAFWRRDVGRSLEYVERSRARSLLDGLTNDGSRGRPLALEALQSSLPEHLSLVYLALLSDKVCRWVVRRSEVRFSHAPVDSAELEDLIAGYREGAGGGSLAELRRRGRRLYELVLPDFEGSVPSEDVVVLVPDTALQSIPFAALVCTEHDRYLIEEHVLATAPSGSTLAAALCRPWATARGTETPLVIAYGAAPKSFESLLAIPEAEREATDVARLYPAARLFTGTAATAEVFLHEGSRAQIVHFAGHAVVNRARPELSSLLLSPDDRRGERGILTAEQIAAAKWDRTRLLVLGACGTTAGRGYRGEGVASLARPFLARGVSAVVGTLWDVADIPSRRLLVEFHSRIRAGDEAGAALRHAQMALIASTDAHFSSPSVWAAFQLIGNPRVSI
jgi:CHAT domain-containing protein/tetratricopeptide (TPR) repeat protein